MHFTMESRATAAVLDVERVLDDVHRVRSGGRVIGYVIEAGAVFVSLKGEVFNTAVEVAQSLELESAVRALANS